MTLADEDVCLKYVDVFAIVEVGVVEDIAMIGPESDWNIKTERTTFTWLIRVIAAACVEVAVPREVAAVLRSTEKPVLASFFTVTRPFTKGAFGIWSAFIVWRARVWGGAQLKKRCFHSCEDNSLKMRSRIQLKMFSLDLRAKYVIQYCAKHPPTKFEIISRGCFKIKMGDAF